MKHISHMYRMFKLQFRSFFCGDTVTCLYTKYEVCVVYLFSIVLAPAIHVKKYEVKHYEQCSLSTFYIRNRSLNLSIHLTCLKRTCEKMTAAYFIISLETHIKTL